MFNLKAKKKTQRERGERNYDMSILRSIQGFKRPFPQQISSSASVSHGRNGLRFSDQHKENIRSQMNSGNDKYYSLKSVPSLITASETRSILYSRAANNIPKKNLQSLNHTPFSSSSENRSGGIRPLPKKPSSSWGIFSSETIKRKVPTVVESIRETAHQYMSTPSTKVEKQHRLPGGGWFQTMIVPPPGSTTPSAYTFKSNKSTSSKTSGLFQSPWVARNSKLKRLEPDPAITKKYSIAQILDIFCGNVPAPEVGFFTRPDPPKSLPRKLSTTRPVRRQLLKEFDEAESSGYFGDNNVFENQNVNNREGQLFEGSQFGHSRTNNQDRVVFKPRYFGNLDGNLELNSRPLMDLCVSPSSASSRTNDLLGSLSSTSRQRHNDKENPLFVNSTNDPVFKRPKDIFFNSPITNVIPLRSSIKPRSFSGSQKRRKKKKTLRFDFDPVPKSQSCNYGLENVDLLGNNDENSSPDIVQLFEISANIGDSEMESSEISPYQFEERMTTENANMENFFPGGLGMIQRNYNSTAFNFENTQTSDSGSRNSKWDQYKEVYSCVG